MKNTPSNVGQKPGGPTKKNLRTHKKVQYGLKLQQKVAIKGRKEKTSVRTHYKQKKKRFPGGKKGTTTKTSIETHKTQQEKNPCRTRRLKFQQYPNGMTKLWVKWSTNDGGKQKQTF